MSAAEESGEYFLDLMIRRARESIIQICFSGSISAFFIDIAERPEVYYPCGQIGRFIGRSRNSWRHGKRKYLSLIK
ncbi:hypothetical protein D4R89_06425 [bacterium]|nr:MAG: hypothetical protein D4R89_06425 [bacterium]